MRDTLTDRASRHPDLLVAISVLLTAGAVAAMAVTDAIPTGIYRSAILLAASLPVALLAYSGVDIFQYGYDLTACIGFWLLAAYVYFTFNGGVPEAVTLSSAPVVRIGQFLLVGLIITIGFVGVWGFIREVSILARDRLGVSA